MPDTPTVLAEAPEQKLDAAARAQFGT